MTYKSRFLSYKVSILVPIFQVEQYIERCARSLFDQDYENVEYIYVDDCSPDNSISILENTLLDYPQRKDQVRIIKHDRNRGLGAARNTAVENATGLFLVHCDSDDWMDTSAVSLMVKRQQETGADIVSGSTCDVNDKFSKVVNDPPFKDKEEFLLQMLRTEKATRHVIWNRLIRASLYFDYHIVVREGVDFGEGFQVFPKLVYYANSVARLDKVTYYYFRANPTSYCKRLKTNNDLTAQFLTTFDILYQFFYDKEMVFNTAASQLACFKYWHYGQKALRSRDRELFERCKSAINGKYSDYQYVLGYKSPLRQWLQQQYLLYGPFLRTRSLSR